MSLPISSLARITGTLASTSVPSVAAMPGTTQSGDFGALLKSAVQNVNQQQVDATKSVQDFLQGNGELHNVALATQRAEMAFDLGMQVRNKVIAAYQEVMKMQL